MVRIPSEYQEVEWLERDVEGAIIVITTDDLNIAGCDVYATFTILGPSDGERAYLGGFSSISGGKSWEVYFPSSHKISGELLTMKDSTITQLGVPGSVHFAISSVSGNLYGLILGMYNYGKVQSKNRIHCCRVEKDGDVLRNLVPCYRKSDNEPGMYDTVTGTFYTNSGTGSFTVGNDVSYSTTNLTETRRKIILNSPHIETASGNICTFSTDMTAKLKSCRVNFLPKQAGSGDPSPDNVRAVSGTDGVEVVRCGKNLLKLSDDNMMYKSLASLSFVYTETGYIATIPETATSDYGFALFKLVDIITESMIGLTFKYSASVKNQSDAFVSCDSNGGNRTSISQGVITSSHVGKTLCFRIYISEGYKPCTVQASDCLVEIVPSTTSQSTAYEPYAAQIIPATFPAQGNNLFDINWLLPSTGSITDGVLTDTAGHLLAAYGVAVGGIPNTDYESQIAISITAKNGQEYTDTGRGFTIKAIYDDGTEGTLAYFGNSITDFTTVTGVSDAGKKVVELYSDFGVGGLNVWDIKDIMIVKGSTAQAYEPYDNTIYGGYVDLVSGELWGEWKLVDMGNTTLNYSNTSTPKYFGLSGSILADREINAYSVMSSMFATNDRIGTSYLPDNYLIGSSGQTAVFVRCDSATSIAEFYELVSGQQLCYKLATPTLITTLTPQQIKTLKGINNVYSDADNINVTYYLH